MWETIPSVLAKFESDHEVRVVVLAGAGDKAFVSARHLAVRKPALEPGSGAALRGDRRAAQARLQTLDKPVLAMIRGYCLGAGVNIANVCDLRIAGDDARFGIPAAKMGLGYRASSMKNLVDTVGAPYAREIMLTARQFSAQEAKTWGSSTMWSRPRTWNDSPGILRPDRRQRAAHHARREAHRARGDEEGLRRRALQTWSGSASRARITPRAGKPSWKRERRFSRANDMSLSQHVADSCLPRPRRRKAAFRASR